MPDSRVAWEAFIEDYDRIRDAIEAVFPIFDRFNERVRERGGFRLPVAAVDGVWNTPDTATHVRGRRP